MTDVSMAIARFLTADESEDLAWLRMVGEGRNNLFVNEWPDEGDEAARVVRYEGGPPSETFTNPMFIRHPRVQITVRHFKSHIALERAEAIMKKLSTVKDQEIDGVPFQRIKPVGEPFEIGKDTTGRERAVVNFQVDFYDSI